MIYLFHIMQNLLPVFILALPFNQREKARSAGFLWNRVIPGAWAADTVQPAINACRNYKYGISIAPATLDIVKASCAMTDETYEYLKNAYVEPDRKTRAIIEAASLTDDQIAAIHQGLRNLAAVCDGAVSEDSAGFNRNDLEYGHGLAAKEQLTRTDAGFASLLIYKYRRQLGEDLYKVIFPEVFEREQRAAQEKVDKKLAKEQTAANKRAEKEAPKLHKKGLACAWSGCQLCTQLPGKEQPQPIELPASSLESLVDVASKCASAAYYKDNPIAVIPDTIGVIDLTRAANSAILPSPAKIERITEATVIDSGYLTQKHLEADPEIIKLAISLIDCFAGDFDVTVDLLRAARKLDLPRKAKSEFMQAAWSASGYETK